MAAQHRFWADTHLQQQMSLPNKMYRSEHHLHFQKFDHITLSADSFTEISIPCSYIDPLYWLLQNWCWLQYLCSFHWLSQLNLKLFMPWPVDLWWEFFCTKFKYKTLKTNDKTNTHIAIMSRMWCITLNFWFWGQLLTCRSFAYHVKGNEAVYAF
jgi:hypothetical protein